MIVESQRKTADARYSRIVEAGDYWLHPVGQGQTLRIVRPSAFCSKLAE